MSSDSRFFTKSGVLYTYYFIPWYFIHIYGAYHYRLDSNIYHFEGASQYIGGRRIISVEVCRAVLLVACSVFVFFLRIRALLYSSITSSV